MLPKENEYLEIFKHLRMINFALGLLWWLSGRRICLQYRRPGSPLGWGDPLEKVMETHFYSCLENPHGQRSLVGSSPQGHKESNMTEQQSVTLLLMIEI